MVYECAVDKSHPQKKYAAQQSLTPYCCGKPMVQVKAAVPAVAGSAAAPSPAKPATAGPQQPAVPARSKSGQKR
ncbi:MAG: hypothetical protein HY927_16690 [Elusimicrobia bacterium]|nr:hypothetical protein [Elusimicrobiota bacterium]